MADIKDTVASHITSNWNAAVLGGSGAVPLADAVGPEDILKPEDYPEAILVYNETVGYDRVYNQGTLGDRHTRVYMLLTAHTRTGCTKTHFRAFIDELKSVFGSAITGFDLQVLDPETNVTRTAGHSGGMYQASFVLHLWEYGISTSSAAAGGAAGASYWAEYFVTTQASANLTNETVLSTKMGAHDFHIIPSADSTYDLGDATHYLRQAYIDAITTTGNVIIGGNLTVTGDLAAALDMGDVTLTNVATLRNDGAITVMPSGDTDDYLAFTTASSVPTITITGHPIMDLRSDGAYAKLRVYDTETYVEATDGTNSLTLYNGASYAAIICNRALRMRMSGDSDDYMEFYTTGNVPRIKSVGAAGVYFETDHATYALFYHCKDATPSKYLATGYHKTDNYGLLLSTDAIRVFAANDQDDYLYFSTATNIAGLYPVEDKVHVLGSAALSFDHVYSDDFDNTSPFELIENPLESLKAIAAKKVIDPKQGEIDALDYTSLPDFVRTHTRDPKKDVIEEYEDEFGNTQEKVLERAPKDVIADEGFSINRMCILLYQAVQELTAKVEALEAQGVPKA